MAAPSFSNTLPFFLCYFLFSLAEAQTLIFSDLLMLPINKHQPTLQYLTPISHGSPPFQIDLALDLGAPFLSIDAPSCRLSSSRRPIARRSIDCSRATASRFRSNSARGNDTCEIFPVNSFTGRSLRAELVEDAVAIGSIRRFLHACAPDFLLQGLAKGVKGVLGLGRRSPISVPSQIAAEFNSAGGFLLCLSSSTGAVLTGIGNRGSILRSKISEPLTYTPLVKNRGNSDHGYFIGINSIKINGQRLPINSSSTLLSTTVPYTTMESSIFAAFRSGFKEAAIGMGLKEVTPVAPFGLCFSSDGGDGSVSWPEVPAIDLILQSGIVKWKMKGRNSMVKARDGVMCLGFLNGGYNQKTSIVLGGHQMEEVLLHFDLESSMLGFSSSLLQTQTSCSNLVI